MKFILVFLPSRFPISPKSQTRNVISQKQKYLLRQNKNTFHHFSRVFSCQKLSQNFECPFYKTAQFSNNCITQILSKHMGNKQNSTTVDVTCGTGKSRKVAYTFRFRFTDGVNMTKSMLDESSEKGI